MDSFFDPQPREDTPQVARARYRSKPWHGPPPGTVPATVPVDRVVARSDDVAIAVTSLEVYPAGLQLAIVAFARPDTEQRDGLDLALFHHQHSRGELSDEVLRVGVAYADGRKATNLQHEFAFPRPDEDGVVFRTEGGGGGGDRYAQTYWIWPIPPEGPLSVVCQWPAHRIPVSRLDIDGDLIRNAAGRAQIVFSEDHLPEEPEDGPSAEGGWSSYVT